MTLRSTRSPVSVSASFHTDKPQMTIGTMLSPAKKIAKAVGRETLNSDGWSATIFFFLLSSRATGLAWAVLATGGQWHVHASSAGGSLRPSRAPLSRNGGFVITAPRRAAVRSAAPLVNVSMQVLNPMGLEQRRAIGFLRPPVASPPPQLIHFKSIAPGVPRSGGTCINMLASSTFYTHAQPCR